MLGKPGRRLAHTGAGTLLVYFTLLANPLGAQATDSTNGARTGRPVASLEMSAASDMEAYLRALQLAGMSSVRVPWSNRPLEPASVDALRPSSDAHPWARAFDFGPERGGTWVAMLPATAEVVGNSGFPFGTNDGPMWAGRGLTAEVQAGFAARLGRFVRVRIDPVAFIAQNASFPLRPNGQSGRLSYNDVGEPLRIDLPQRFGSSSYGRVDPGDSYIRVDLGPIAAGVSTANEWWGPTTRYPFILGTNAAGIPHAFVGTSHPVGPAWLRIGGHLLYGIESQSAYSPVTGSKYYVSVDQPGTRRFASGFVATVQTSTIPGLEFGAGRYFHSIIPSGGVPASYLKKPLQGLFKAGLPVSAGFNDTQGGADNQQFSLMARWAIPGAGAEVYAEYGREDHNYDLRDALEEPDHARAYSLGLQKVFSPTSRHMSVLRAEVVDGEPSETARHRDEGQLYIHSLLRQGHTQDGQLLGTAIGAARFAGAIFALDRYDPSGAWTFGFERTVSNNSPNRTVSLTRDESTVANTVSAERLHFFAHGDVRVGGSLTDALDWLPNQDRMNANVFVRVTLRTTAR